MANVMCWEAAREAHPHGPEAHLWKFPLFGGLLLKQETLIILGSCYLPNKIGQLKKWLFLIYIYIYFFYIYNFSIVVYLQYSHMVKIHGFYPTKLWFEPVPSDLTQLLTENMLGNGVALYYSSSLSEEGHNISLWLVLHNMLQLLLGF